MTYKAIVDGMFEYLYIDSWSMRFKGAYWCLTGKANAISLFISKDKVYK